MIANVKKGSLVMDTTALIMMSVEKNVGIRIWFKLKVRCLLKLPCLTENSFKSTSSKNLVITALTVSCTSNELDCVSIHQVCQYAKLILRQHFWKFITYGNQNLGSFTCECQINMEGNGTHCEDINECDDQVS